MSSSVGLFWRVRNTFLEYVEVDSEDPEDCSNSRRRSFSADSPCVRREALRPLSLTQRQAGGSCNEDHSLSSLLKPVALPECSLLGSSTPCCLPEENCEGPKMARGATTSTDAGQSMSTSPSSRSWDRFQAETSDSIEETVDETENSGDDEAEVDPLVVMVRNLWCKCTPQMLANILNEMGLSHKEVYVPIRKSEKRVPTNHGYGFVTLNCQEELDALHAGLDQVSIDFGNTKRTLSLTHAHAHCDMQERRPWCLWPQPVLEM